MDNSTEKRQEEQCPEGNSQSQLTRPIVESNDPLKSVKIIAILSQDELGEIEISGIDYNSINHLLWIQNRIFEMFRIGNRKDTTGLGKYINGLLYGSCEHNLIYPENTIA